MNTTKHRHPVMTQITLLLLSSLVVMSGASLSSALPPIQDYFFNTPNVGFWVRMLLTTPALFIVLSAPLAGAFIDKFGRKKLLVSSIALYGIAGTSGFFMRSIWGLLAGRALIGIAIAIIFTTTTALIADYYQGPSRARFLGLQAGFMSTSGILFHPIGGALADLGWHVTFLIYATAFLYLPLAVLYLYEPITQSQEPVILQGSKRLRHVIPLVSLLAIYTLTFLGQIIFYIIPVQLPFHLRSFDLGSMGLIGLITGFGSLMMGLSGLFYGQIKNKFNYLTIIGFSFGLITAGYLMIGLARDLWVLLLGLVIAGLGLGLNTPNLVSWLVTLAPFDMRGRALGTRLRFNYLGQFLSPIVAQPLIAAFDIPAAYLAAAALGGIILIFSLVAKIGRDPRNNPPETDYAG